VDGIPGIARTAAESGACSSLSNEEPAAFGTCTKMQRGVCETTIDYANLLGVRATAAPSTIEPPDRIPPIDPGQELGACPAGLVGVLSS
jgi:hypothetical protein